MNNLFKLENSVARIARLFGIIALVAIIGFSFATCSMGDDDTTNNNNQQTQAPDVTFTLSDGTAGDNKYEVTVSGAEWGYANIHALMESDVQYLETVITISSDKKKVEVAVYDAHRPSGGTLINEDKTTTVTFGEESDSTEGFSLLTYTSVAYSPASDFWDMDARYKGTVTLVEPPEGVTITVKDNVFKPE